MVISHSEALCGSLTALRLTNGSSGDKRVVKASKNCSPARSYCWQNTSNIDATAEEEYSVTDKAMGSELSAAGWVQLAHKNIPVFASEGN